MTKTLVRASGAINRLRAAFSDIGTSGVPFDTLQFVLMDRPAGYTHLEGARGEDRLFQVHIGAGDMPCGLGQERDFVAGLARTIHTAINELPVSKSIIRDMRAAIEREITEPTGCTERRDSAAVPIRAPSARRR